MVDVKNVVVFISLEINEGRSTVTSSAGIDTGLCIAPGFVNVLCVLYLISQIKFWTGITNLSHENQCWKRFRLVCCHFNFGRLH